MVRTTLIRLHVLIELIVGPNEEVLLASCSDMYLARRMLTMHELHPNASYLPTAESVRLPP